MATLCAIRNLPFLTTGGYFTIQSPFAQLTNTSVTIGTTGVAVDREEIGSFTLTIRVCHNCCY